MPPRRGHAMTARGKIDILVLEGDGIGPEIIAATLRVLQAADRAFGLGLAFEPRENRLGGAPRRTARRSRLRYWTRPRPRDGVLLGPVSHNDYPPVAEGGLNPSGELRKRLDLYANIRPARSRAGFPPRCGSAGRSRDRAREHRRLLRRPLHASRPRRIHADAGSRARGAQDHAARARPASRKPRSSSPCSGARR